MRATVWLLSAVLIGWTALGCRDRGGQTRGPAQTQPASQAASAKAPTPDVPAGAEEEALVSKVLIQDTTVADRHRREKYKQDGRAPSGSLLGVCYVPFDKALSFPREAIVDVDEDASAVKDPEKGEADYYRRRPPREPVPLGPHDPKLKRYGVGQAVLTLRSIDAGKRPTLNRPSFLVNYRTGQFEVAGKGYNYGSGNLCFGPAYERIQLCTTEFYSCQLVITHVPTGKAFFEGRLEGYQDPKFPGERFGSNFGMARPKLLATGPVLETGLYKVTCRKHPWHRAWLFVTDNPYGCVSSANGMFNMDDVPEGTYGLEVWHEQYEPLQTTFQVEVKAFKKTEVPVEFKPPAVLTSPPAMPDQDVKQWAFIGPFSPRQPSYPPQKALDFKAAYDGKDGRRVAWKLVEADKNGLVDLATACAAKDVQRTVSFFCATLDSPRGQKAVLGVGADDSVALWLNDVEVLLPDQRGGGRNALYVPVKLAQGRNVLLARLTNGEGGGGLWLSFKADGATPGVPDVPNQ